MAVPPVPSAIAGAARPYPDTFASLPSKSCTPPKEGARIIPLSFKFNQTQYWLVDLSQAQPGDSFSQLVSIYIDASQCLRDVQIFFPDTGYSTLISFGDTVTLNVLTSNLAPKFYIGIIEPFLNAVDIVNVQCSNVLLPPMRTNLIGRNIAYGYGQFNVPTPIFAASGAAGFSQEITHADYTIINALSWYITAISLQIASTSTAAELYELTLMDNGVPFFYFFYLPGTATTALQKVCDLSGLNYKSGGNGPLTISTSRDVNLTASTAAGTIFGGIL